eukprot:SAG11_NODE_1132_length_5752_cov_8.739685_5_plen_40_part_00
MLAQAVDGANGFLWLWLGRTEGVRGYYRGMAANVARMIP